MAGPVRRLNLAVAALVAACAGPPALPACEPGVATAFPVWMVDYGWHTELVIPVGPITGPLAPIAALFPGARTLSFGFGKRSFITLSDPGLLDFAAGAVPGAGAIRIIGLNAEPGRIYGRVTQIPLTEPVWTRLTGFLSRSIARGPSGAPIPVMPEPGYPAAGRFFAATPGYSLAYTCNAWSVDALHTAGLAVAGTVIFAGGAMHEAATIRNACAP